VLGKRATEPRQGQVGRGVIACSLETGGCSDIVTSHLKKGG
jgi:hypothetical protein